MTRFKARQGVARFREFHDQTGVEFQATFLGATADAAPSRRAVGERLGTTDESDLAVAERVKMFQRHVAAYLIVDDHGTDGISLQFTADHRCRYAAFFQIPEQVDIEEKPVGDHNQRLNTAVEKHFQVALEAAALVVYVGKNGEGRSVVERVFT